MNDNVSNQNDETSWRGQFGGRLGRLIDAMYVWDNRDDAQTQPEVTEAGLEAMQCIDDLLAQLHSLRSRLVTEIHERRETQDAAWDAKHGRTPLIDGGSGPFWSPDDNERNDGRD